MSNPFNELKEITDSVYAGYETDFANATLALLERNGIKIRQKDGSLCQVNISIPKSRSDSILVGFRYTKKDGSNTEDHFLFEKGHDIVPFYKGKIEKILPEYKGTHKAQIK